MIPSRVHLPASGIYPFFDELVVAQILGLGKVAFTAAYYQRYAAALRERAARLNAQRKHREWTAYDLSRAMRGSNHAE